MSQLRVFEFAKEIGIETLNLMDKLREWEIPVKNHMASLDSETIELIRNKLDEEKKSQAVKKKPATRKKAVAKKVEKTEAPVAKKTVAKKAVGTVKKTAEKRTVLRRKAEEMAAVHEAQQHASEEAEVLERVHEDNPQQTEAAGTPVQTSTEAVQKAPIKQNIIGKMDLNRVKPLKAQYGPGQGGHGHGHSSSGGMNSPTSISGGGSRSIRTGFVAAPLDSYIDYDHEERKKKIKEEEELEKERKKKARETGEEVQGFTATEFRKREIIFQPKKKKSPSKESKKTQITTAAAHKRIIKIEKTIKLSDFAQQLGIKAAQLTSRLMKEGMMVTLNSDIDFETAAIIAPEYKHEVINVHQTAEQIINTKNKIDENPENMRPRIPVVTVMGHVDHGKTSLLDAIRKSDVASGEAGGITQHIGAYKVTLESGKSITFIDTPGHEAFTAMRARGANVTDIVILVVAADDGVMPQTVEALNHAKSAGVPIIVAVNKMDKPQANPDRIKQQLSEYELLPEDWGGQTIFAPVSAIKKQGIKELLEQVLLVAEMQELKANPNRPATGIVVESRMEKGRGVVATLLIKNGTLKNGQSIVAGTAYGRVRAMQDDKGKKLDEVLPGEPVELLGLNHSPLAGDPFDVTDSEETAREVAAKRLADENQLKDTPNSKMSLETIFSKIQSGNAKELPIILKADVAGSVEAVKGLLEKTGNDEVKVRVLHSAVGGITESDVLLAQTSEGLIIGFNVRPDTSAQTLAKQRGIEIKTYSIIYELVDDIKKALSGLLAPEVRENILGSAEVRQIFTVPKIGTIAGCFVKDGKITRSSMARLIRDGRMIYEGKLSSLKRFKDDAREVASGYECGIGIENYNDIKVGDTIEAFEKQEISRSI